MHDDATGARSEPAHEADSRFPSGPWLGFWLQRRMPGRNWMRDLVLQFSNGRAQGEGADCVGRFTLAGRYDLTAGRVTLHKRYVGAHVIVYDGQNEDDGRWVWGVWTLRESTGVDRGGFHIWPKGQHDPTANHTAVERQVEAPEPVLA